MKKLFILLLAATMLLPVACTEPNPGPVPTPEQPTPDPDPEPEPEPEPKYYSVGDYYKEGLAEGVVVYIDDTAQHGILMSLEESYQQWSTEYCGLTDMGYPFSHDNGAYNMTIIKEQENWKELYPAFAWCDQKNALGLSSWYLPAVYEMEYAYINREAINTTLNELGETPLSEGVNDSYWTSTEVGVQSAYSFSFYYGEISSYDNDKQNEHRVRAMRKF